MGEVDTYHARIAYGDASGRVGEFTASGGSSRKRTDVGTVVPVLLLRGSPDIVEVGQPGWLMAGPIILLALGATTLSLPYLTR